MIDTTTFTQRNLVTGTIVAALLAVCAVALLVFVNDSSSETAAGITTKSGPAVIGEKDATTGIASVTLIEKAAERLGIETVAVAEANDVREGSSGSLAVPYGAILYDAEGSSFVYTVAGPLSYVRAAITVDYVEGDRAILSDGPPVGTDVVSVGVAELYGAETGLK
jgi:hypothetical protein